MIAWINFGVLIVSGGLMTALYLISVQPAALEKKIGPVAYQRCGTYRMWTRFVMVLFTAKYILYIGIPAFDPFHGLSSPYGESAAIAVLIAIPASTWRSQHQRCQIGDLRRDNAHRYKGIYEKSPPMAGRGAHVVVHRFLVNSPFPGGV